MFPVDRCLIIALVLLAGVRSKTLVESPVISQFEESDETTPTTINGCFENETARTLEENDLGSPVDGSLPHLGNLIDKLQEEPDLSEEGRTFGVKRLQFMLMPMMYKMGVMMTMLAVLTVISLKGLAIGVILLVLKLSAFFGKFYAITSHHAPIQSWPAQPPQPVHVHVHNSGGGSHHPYNGWESVGGPPDDEHYYYKG